MTVLQGEGLLEGSSHADNTHHDTPFGTQRQEPNSTMTLPAGNANIHSQLQTEENEQTSHHF